MKAIPLVLLGLSFPSGSVASAQAGDLPGERRGETGDPPVVELIPLPEGVAPPHVDGELDDEAWGTAARLGPLTQLRPNLGAPGSVASDIRVLFDGEALYVGFRCFDDEPIVATVRQRDGRQSPNDHILVVLDSFEDGRNAYAFFLGAAGGISDGIVSKNDSQQEIGWDAIWQGRSRVTAEGWQGEMRIPVASIPFDPDATSWRFNVRRDSPSRFERQRWADPFNARRSFDMSRAGTLEGIDVTWDGLGLDVRPFVVGDAVRERDFTTSGVDTDTELDLEVGADVFYRLTPNVKLGLSLNTDFAETEIDQRLVNRTRFPLFLPEKRDFFLEDTEVFTFGPPLVSDVEGPARIGRRARPENLPFFSRRVGLGPNSEEVPLLVASKLTGRTKENAFGVLGVRTEEEGDLDAQSLFVARYSHNLGTKSDVGVLVTAGDPADAGGDATYGVDLNLRTNRFRGEEDSPARFSGYVLRSEGEPEGDDLAYSASFVLPGDEVELGVEHTVFQENYRPALGFLLRDGVKKYRADAYWRPLIEERINRVEFGATAQLFTDASEDTTEIVDVAVRLLGLIFKTGDAFQLNLDHQRDVLDVPFQVVRGFGDTTVPSGSYTFTSAGASVEFADDRPVSGLVMDLRVGGS